MTSSVTVCVPTIPTREHLLNRAVASTQSQTVLPDALSVALDTEGEGAAATRNRTWRRAVTEWVAFLDDDDELRPTHIELLLDTARANDADLVYPWFNIVDNAGNDMTSSDPLRITHDGQLVSPFGIAFGEQHKHELFHRSNFIPVTVLVRRELLADAGGFPNLNSPEWPENCCEDWAMWRRLLDVGATFAHLPERTWLWYWHGANTSGRSWNGAHA